MTHPSRRENLMRPKMKVLTFAILLICSGCAVGPDFKRPDAPAVAGLTRETGTITSEASTASLTNPQHYEIGAEVKRQWWSLYASPMLNDLVERSLKQNPSIEAAQAALKQAQANSAAQRGYYLPTIQAGYSPTRQGNSNTIAPTLNSGDTPFSLNTAQVSVGFVLDVFGLNRRTVESLDAQAENQKFMLDAAYVTLATNVVSAAIQQAALQAQLIATQEIIRTSTHALKVLQQQATLGFSSSLDVAVQETVLAQNQQLLPPLRKQLEQTRNQLAVLAGKLPAQGGFENFDFDTLSLPQALPLSLPSQIVEQRPDVRAAEAQLHASSALVGVSIANRLPQFSLTAFLGGAAVPFSQMFTNNNQFWGVTGNVTQTVFDFGTLKYRQVAAEAALEQASALYRSTVLTAFQNVSDTLYALDADAHALQAANNAATAAKKSFDLTQAQLSVGSVNVLTLLLAEQAYYQAKISQIQAKASQLTDTAALFQSLGGGWSEPIAIAKLAMQTDDKTLLTADK